MRVTSRQIVLSRPFITERGARLHQPEVAFEEYGRASGPVILIAHGGLSNHHAAGRYGDEDPAPGWWDGLIGPGLAFDTDRYRIVSANALGGMFGTTSPRTTDPATHERYGPRFPDITLVDIARFARAFLDELGIEMIHVVAGPSMGSLVALQMAALYPEDVGAVVAVATAGRMPPSGMAMHHLICNALSMDPQFRDGWYDESRPLPAMRWVAQMMRVYYTHDRAFHRIACAPVADGPDAQQQRSEAVRRFLVGNFELDARDRDPNCLIATLRAINSYDLGRHSANYEAGVARIRCPALLMNIDSDGEFPPEHADEVAAILNARRPGQASAHVLRSDWGHLGCVRELAQINEHIVSFLRGWQ